MTTTDTTDITLAPDDPALPAGRVAPGTHRVELARLARMEQASPACDPLVAQAFLWLSRACAAAQGALGEGLRPLGLSMSAFHALMALHDEPEATLEPWQIAERLGVSRPSVTGLLDTLQTRGLVLRGPHADDRRRVLVALTPAGRQLVDSHLAEHFEHQRALFADLTQEEQLHLVGLLRRVRGAMPAELASDAPPA